MAAKENALGEFLRARRDQVRPEDVGLVPGGHRRVLGLRREELAMLAGISAEYYLRLERGRARNPSPQVLVALARVLHLDPKATKYLHELAMPNVGRCDESELEAVAEKLDELIDQLPFPAIVANRYLDVMAANPVGRALSPGFTPGENFLRWRLLDPAAKELYIDWDRATDCAVNGLRAFAGRDGDDPRLQALVAELSAASARFRELWALADVGYSWGSYHLRHPLVGELHLYQNQLNVPHVPSCEGQHVIIYRAEPASETARRLEELMSQSTRGAG